MKYGTGNVTKSGSGVGIYVSVPFLVLLLGNLDSFAPIARNSSSVTKQEEERRCDPFRSCPYDVASNVAFQE